MGSWNSKIRNVVVLVNENMNQSKINAIGALCRRRVIKIILVTIVNEYDISKDVSASSLLQLFQRLKTNMNCPVEYSVVPGHNKGKAILKFSEDRKADILLLDLMSETKIGWTGRHLPDALPASSKIQVLTV